MSNSTYLQEDLENMVYTYHFDVDYFCESSHQIFYTLAASRSCGLLMLIGRLLDQKETKSIQQKLRNYFLAKRLINNFYEIKVSIAPPQVEEAVSFISQMIDNAKTITNAPNSSNPIVLIYAKRLINLIDVCERTSETTLNHAVEKTFEEFATHYFQDVFYQLIKASNDT